MHPHNIKRRQSAWVYFENNKDKVPGQVYIPKDTKRVFKKCTNLLGTLAYSSFQWVMREKATEATMCLSSRLFSPATDATTFACPWREMQRPMLFQKSFENGQQLQSLPFLLGRMLYINPNSFSVKYWGRLINVTLNYSLKDEALFSAADNLSKEMDDVMHDNSKPNNILWLFSKIEA